MVWLYRGGTLPKKSEPPSRFPTRGKKIGVTMRKILAATALAGAMLAAPAVANAATFTQSDFAGPGNFGTITAMDLGGGVEQFSLNMAPNVLLQTGSHFLFTFSLTGGGFIDPNSIAFGGTASNVSVLPHTDPASYMNAPFKFFSDGISADCGSGGSGGGCGSTLIFNVDNFVGLAAATQLYNGLSIFAAADILLGNCSGGGPTG